MRDRDRIRFQENLREAHHVLLAQAEQDLSEAMQNELRRREDQKAARAALEASTDDWLECLAGSSIDPLQLGQLTARISEREARLRGASELVERASEQSLARRRTLAEREVHEKHIDKSLRQLRKHAAYAAEEAAAAVIEDRLTFARVRP